MKSSTRTTASGKTSVIPDRFTVIPDLIGNLKTLKTMKKNILSALAICAALLGCQKNEISETRPSGVELHATIEDDASTKTVIDENNNIRWSEGDQIIAFMKSSYGHKYKLIPSFIGKTYANFEQVASDGGNLSTEIEWNHNVVYYPYSADIKAVKSGENYNLSVILPSEQTYTAKSFGNGSFPMVAVADTNNVTFKNICGGMKILLKGTQKVASIMLEGKNCELLSGSATVTAYTDSEIKPAITMDSDASTSVSLNCVSGVQLNENTPSEFIVSLPPVAFTKGFILTITDVVGKTYTVETDKANTVLRSSILVMPEITLVLGSAEVQKLNYIDEFGIDHGPGIQIGDVVWAPVNCGYHATDYKYGKLYQWGRKYGQGYNGDIYMENDSNIGVYSDATIPEIVEGPISDANGQDEEYSNSFFKVATSPNDWMSSQDDKLWNSGTEENPIKTEYDPCPTGWRVPTKKELLKLKKNKSSLTTNENGQVGYWFCGANSYSETVPSVFFPAAGDRYGDDGYAYDRGNFGFYWSSTTNSYYAYYLFFDSDVADMYDFYRTDGYSVRCVQDVPRGDVVPVGAVDLSRKSLVLPTRFSYTLTARITPIDATDQTPEWSSDNPAVVAVDRSGVITTMSDGIANITAVAGGVAGTCTITVIAPTIREPIDYGVDGVSYGKGIVIGDVIWAPVNCGYEPSASNYKGYPYGKLYQWGRKYGQGYSTSDDATEPEIVKGPISSIDGQNENYSNTFFKTQGYPNQWQQQASVKSWNLDTEENPVRTEYDPCPKGWRVPTCAELDQLNNHYSSWLTVSGQKGRYFCGDYTYLDNVPQVFLPAAGYREYHDGYARSRGDIGWYWSSKLSGKNAVCLYVNRLDAGMSDIERCAHGYSVRCVQE